MTKLKLKIVKNKREETPEKLLGAYLATFNNEDDRIIFFANLNAKLVRVINPSYEGKLIMQKDQAASNYSNLKKIKKLTIEIELE